MAPRSPASARGSDQSRVPAYRTYSPELLADGRRRFEETAETYASIAADFGIHPRSLGRVVRREGWVRGAKPRGLPTSARVLAEMEALAQAAAKEQAATPEPAAHEPAAAESLPEKLDRVEKAAMAELATVEAMRAQLGRTPAKPSDAARTAQTLASLTDTLQKVQRMRCGLAPAGDLHDDDIPADLDEFRRDLARRIDAFIASRLDGHDADGAAAAALVEGA